jgi:hypothetical protein
MRSSVEIEMKFIPKTKRQNGKISFLQRLSEREDVWIRRRVCELHLLAIVRTIFNVPRKKRQAFAFSGILERHI